nr:PAS domain S-box protein [Mucilaginibacter segetis]
MDSINEAEFDRITEIASIICDVPISLISLIDKDRQWFKSKIGLDVNETPRELAFCRYAIMDPHILEIQDAITDERFKNNLLVTGEPGIRFYAGTPLVDPEGYALGTLCVIDRKPKKLSAKQLRALKLLGEEVISKIVERRQKEELKNFENIFRRSNDLIFIGGGDGFFKKVNPAFTKVLGWSKEQLLNTSTFEFIHPDDIASTEIELKKLAHGHSTVNFIQRFKTISGSYKTLQWTSSPEASTGYIFGIGRDISKEKEKEEQLAESEEKLRVFFENSQGLMCTHDLEGKFLSVNTSGASTLGYTPQEITQMSLFDIIPQERHPYLNAYLDEIKKSGSVKGQMLTRHKNGSLHVWLFNNFLQKGATGEEYVIGNAYDITERERLQNDLIRTKEMLEQTNKVARVGGWDFNLEKQEIYWTSVTKEIHGVPQDYEPDLKSGINFYKEGDSRDRITQAINLGIAEGKSWNEELQIIDVSGKEVWVRALGNTEFENGVCKRLFGTFQDIDAYKEAELALKRSVAAQERLNEALLEQIELVKEQDKTIEKIQEFKFLADSIPQMIWTSQADGYTDYYNRYWFDYTGMTLEQTQTEGWEPVLHPDDLENDTNLWNESLATGKPYDTEVRFKRASDGAYRWHISRAVPMKNNKGEIVKWFGSCTDIDEYKKALDLENKISQYEDFNRIVAHNLRGPAGSIGMILTMLDETTDENEKADLLKMLSQSSETLNETLNELMKVLEVRNNHDLTYDDCDLQEIVNGIEKMLKGQMVAKKARIITDFNKNHILFPKIYLESIFYNLISNALKYSKDEIPPEIIISSTTKADKTLLTFKDNGLGIDLKQHGNNMFKLNKVFHRGYDSKGVGLFMTKTQIETFGGKISVQSDPGVGSEFFIEL